ncbi:MAG: hypothetical protein IBJ04_09495 [Hydrogenophaga sp.]|uniref:hypothetical protein n=1 Tax=Hydrogenophaga sp. TaxID=1904254 RepID=UPI00257DCCB8|nr:hypothetical protein [Hydrogenophaga sp.]MBL0944545.1 hypothetical protein [Hydrogenophaga sp.]
MSESNHPLSARQRRHTSPQAKWLLNEAAALRGELARVVTKQARLAKREAELRKTLAALELVAAPLPVPAGIAAPTVVNAHNRFGPRGHLTKLILVLLQSAWPKGADIHSLVDWVAASCGIEFTNTAERTDCRHSVRRRLHHLAEQGKAERLESIGSDANGAGVWRLVRKNNVSLSELEHLATKANLAELDSQSDKGNV